MSADKDSKDENELTTDLPQEDEAPREAPLPDYEVGYGRPPKETRFQPGQSGNPRGRPKGTKNLKTDLTEELRETIDVREGDRSSRVSKQRALVKTLVARTLKGDSRAAGHLLTLILRLVDTGEGVSEVGDDVTADEAAILHAFEERVKRRAVASAKPAEQEGDERSEGES